MSKPFFPIGLVLMAMLLLPNALIAQNDKATVEQKLKNLGLTDKQVSQVQDIQASTRQSVRLDQAQIRIQKAQLAKLMLATPVDSKAVNDLIDQQAQTRAHAQKTLAGAKIQLKALLGDSKYQAYAKTVARVLKEKAGSRLGERGRKAGKDNKAGKPAKPWQRPGPRNRSGASEGSSPSGI